MTPRATPSPTRETLPMFVVGGEHWRHVPTSTPRVYAVQRRSERQPDRWITLAEVVL